MKPLQTITDEIREACFKANPEIKELKFGCQFLWHENEASTEYCAVFENWVTKNESVRCMTRPFFQQAIVTKDRITEILGREIHLADVLLAIKKEKVKGLLSPEMKRISEFWEIQKILDCWNLLKDNLDDQEEATKRFIHSLLSK